MSYTGTTPKFDSVEGDNIKVDGNTISSTNENGDINLVPDGTGKVKVSTQPALDSSSAAASTEYVDLAVSVESQNLINTVSDNYLNLDGSVPMTGDLDLGGNKIENVAMPTEATDGVNKQYADSISGGVVTRPAVKAATTVSLGGVYNNGVGDNGIGATLNLGPLATLDIDGITTWSQFDGILVKNQTPSLQNGRYYVSQIGGISTDWILTRCGTCDESSEMPASYMFVQFGNTNAGKGFVALVGTSAGPNSGSFDIGYDNITFTQFTGGTAYTAGAGLNLSTGNEFSARVDDSTIRLSAGGNLTLNGATLPVTNVSDWNNVISTGFFQGNNAANAPISGADIWCIGYCVRHTDQWITQEVWNFSQFGNDAGAQTIWRRQSSDVGGVRTWGPWVDYYQKKSASSGQRLLRITSFTSSGTWTKQADVGRIHVKLVGGGGGGAGVDADDRVAGASGGTTSFGSYLSATGGGGATADLRGGGAGSGSGGNYNADGSDGNNAVPNAGASIASTAMSGNGGSSLLGGAGRGGYTTSTSAGAAGSSGGPRGGGGGGGAYYRASSLDNRAIGGAGGGGGGYSEELLLASAVTSTVAVTIGGGGAGGNSDFDGGAGASGVVIIYEYGA